MKIQGDGYSIEYDAKHSTVHLCGIMRLKNEAYAPLAELLDQLLQQHLSNITLNLRQLKALNSSGITLLAKFIAQLNRQKNTQLMICAAPHSAWQKKSLGNFQRLMPDLHTSYQQETAMEVKGEDFSLVYHTDTGDIQYQGIVRLHGNEYSPIEHLFEQVLKDAPTHITLDVRALQALNSSGITTLARFVANLRKQGSSSLCIQGSSHISWQKKSVKNFQRLMPDILFEWDTAH